MRVERPPKAESRKTLSAVRVLRYSITAAASDEHWLRSIRDVYEANMDELRPLDVGARAKRVCELNVLEQVERLAQTSVISDAWQKRRGPWLHGWIYGLEDGRLRELVAVEPGCQVGPEYPNDV